MKTVSLKLTDKEIAKKKKEWSQPVSSSPNPYPWGTRITLEDDLAKKVPGTEGAKSKQKVKISGEGFFEEITERVNDINGKKTVERTISIQLTSLGLETDGAFKKAFDEDKEED